MNWKTCLTTSIAVLFTACATTEPPPPPDPVVVPEFVYPDCGNPPERDPIKFEIPKVVILEAPDGNQVYTLTAAEWGVLGKNILEIRKGAQQLADTVNYYVRCIEAN